MAKHEMWELQSMQAMPLSAKILLTQQRIREWVNEFGIDGVYVSFSGGKDSTVLLHIARQMYPEIKAVFSNTGLEFPETVSFVKTFDNVDFVKPKMSYMSVIKKYGYPLISKEVSECVWGARKYLTSVIESEMALTDRQTDRQAISGTSRSIVSCADSLSTTNLTGGGTRTSTANSEESETTLPVRMAETQRNWWIWRAVQQCQKTGLGGWRSQTLRQDNWNPHF